MTNGGGVPEAKRGRVKIRSPACSGFFWQLFSCSSFTLLLSVLSVVLSAICIHRVTCAMIAYQKIIQSDEFFVISKSLRRLLEDRMLDSIGNVLDATPRSIQKTLKLGNIMFNFIWELILNTGVRISKMSDISAFLERISRSMHPDTAKTVEMMHQLSESAYGNLSPQNEYFFNQKLKDFAKLYINRWIGFHIGDISVDMLLSELSSCTQFVMIGFIFLELIFGILLLNSILILFSLSFFRGYYYLILYNIIGISLQALFIWAFAFAQSTLEAQLPESDQKAPFLRSLFTQLVSETNGYMEEYRTVAWITQNQRFEFLTMVFDKQRMVDFAQFLINMTVDRNLEKYLKYSDVYLFYFDTEPWSTNNLRSISYQPFLQALEDTLNKYWGHMATDRNLIAQQAHEVMVICDKFTFLFSNFKFSFGNLIWNLNMHRIIDILLFETNNYWPQPAQKMA